MKFRREELEKLAEEFENQKKEIIKRFRNLSSEFFKQIKIGSLSENDELGIPFEKFEELKKELFKNNSEKFQSLKNEITKHINNIEDVINNLKEGKTSRLDKNKNNKVDVEEFNRTYLELLLRFKTELELILTWIHNVESLFETFYTLMKFENSEVINALNKNNSKIETLELKISEMEDKFSSLEKEISKSLSELNQTILTFKKELEKIELKFSTASKVLKDYEDFKNKFHDTFFQTILKKLVEQGLIAFFIYLLESGHLKEILK